VGNPIPVVSLFRGDFLYNLVLIEDTDTVATVAEKCAAHSVGRRVAPSDAPLQVEYGGSFVDTTATAAEIGIVPMGEVIVSYATGDDVGLDRLAEHR
jgi:toluene monooxygenase system protein B